VIFYRLWIFFGVWPNNLISTHANSDISQGHIIRNATSIIKHMIDYKSKITILLLPSFDIWFLFGHNRNSFKTGRKHSFTAATWTLCHTHVVQKHLFNIGLHKTVIHTLLSVFSLL